MFVRLFLLFVLLPLADLVLIWMLLQIHIGITVLWILVSGLVGAWYVRRQGTEVMADLRATVADNQLPTNVLVEGALVLFAGGLLITPGLLTDLFGFSMLIKPCRRWYRKRILSWLKGKLMIQTGTMRGSFSGEDIIDAEVVRRKGGDSASDSAHIVEPEKLVESPEVSS